MRSRLGAEFWPNRLRRAGTRACPPAHDRPPASGSTGRAQGRLVSGQVRRNCNGWLARRANAKLGEKRGRDKDDAMLMWRYNRKKYSAWTGSFIQGGAGHKIFVREAKSGDDMPSVGGGNAHEN